jgi:hypothetical protein
MRHGCQRRPFVDGVPAQTPLTQRIPDGHGLEPLHGAHAT